MICRPIVCNIIFKQTRVYLFAKQWNGFKHCYVVLIGKTTITLMYKNIIFFSSCLLLQKYKISCVRRESEPLRYTERERERDTDSSENLSSSSLCLHKAGTGVT